MPRPDNYKTEIMGEDTDPSWGAENGPPNERTLITDEEGLRLALLVKLQEVENIVQEIRKGGELPLAFAFTVLVKSGEPEETEREGQPGMAFPCSSNVTAGGDRYFLGAAMDFLEEHVNRLWAHQPSEFQLDPRLASQDQAGG